MAMQLLGVGTGTMVCLAAVALCLVLAVRQLHAALARRSPASSWPQVRGTVLSATVQVSTQGHTRHETPLVLYSYRVGNREFQGNRVHLGALTRHAANDIVARYPAGSCVQVFYDPADPTRSALER